MAKQPPRASTDGPIDVYLDDEDRLVLTCKTDGETSSVVMGKYNAWRAVGLLAVMLRIPLPAKLSEGIQMTCKPVER